jgi:general secretion pathway protein L
MSRRVVGLDLGAYSVKLVRLECGKSIPKFEIIDAVEEVLPCDDERDLLEKQKEAIIKLHQQGFLEAEILATGLESYEGQMRTLPVPFLEIRKIEATLPGILEAEVPFNIDDMIMSWHKIEEQNKELEKAEGGTIRIAFGKKQAIARNLKLLQPLSIDPRIMHLSSTALYELSRELGFEKFSSKLNANDLDKTLSTIIDFGHRTTNLCVFDESGIKFSRSFLRGGKKLTEDIANALAIPFCEAEKLKHENVNLLGQANFAQDEIANQVALAHYKEICQEISRTFISLKTSGFPAINCVTLVGGSIVMDGFKEYFSNSLADFNLSIQTLTDIVPEKISSSAMGLPLAFALSCLQVHAKDNRFNFRKDEFVWRGELDFLRTKSTPLILWSLVLICSLTILWSASSLVLKKENEHVENSLKNACSDILGQRNIAPKKCLTQMKEQITASVDVGIPNFTASDIYLKMAEVLPKDLNITISELDILEKKVRISAETTSFENIDKIVANLNKISCLINIERGRAQQKDSLVKFNLSGDIECHSDLAKSKTKS